MAKPGAADLIPKNFKALRGALEHSVTIQLGRLQQVADDLVSAGSLTRAEADKLVGSLVTSSKGYSQALISVVDALSAETRKNVEAGVAGVVAPVLGTAGKIAGTVRKAAPGRTPAPKPVAKPASKPKSSATSKPVALDPIPGYSDLTVAQVKPKLARLGPADLRRVRKTEAAGKKRKSLLAEIDRLLEK
ncbi:MAG TPA: hypothetical protein VNS81_10625 [Nocardioides sp.]|nr:hypothetical protein [Nocardioides sp.]